VECSTKRHVESRGEGTWNPNAVSGRIMTGSLGFYVRFEGSGPPVLFLHGFTGSHRSWDDVAAHLSKSYTVVRPDLPGHAASVVGKGQSWSMDTVVFGLLRLMRELGFPTFSCVGYSMGGRVALSMAVKAPARLDGLVLESASPGLQDADLRAARMKDDDALADRMVSSGLLSFVDEWGSKPLFATHERVPGSIRERQRNIRLSHLVTGLASSLRHMGTGAQAPVWDGLTQMSVPTLLITGERDGKFIDIARQMESRLPNAMHEIVEDAGHTVHLEQPESYHQLLEGFLQQHAKRLPLSYNWTRGLLFANDEEQ
jgi:2-succinyl-6-hydroxy-2,4-cyclohexadiene-1-carboxylate synthase